MNLQYNVVLYKKVLFFKLLKQTAEEVVLQTRNAEM